MSKLLNVNVGSIEPNPYRNLDHYPWIEEKIDALRRSIDEVGFWEGVICRKVGDVYQLAFGHHRLEAAKRNGMTSIRVVVRDLTDKQMIQFLGRENGEEYKSDFQVMMNTWDGAIQYMKESGRSPAELEIAELLGWRRKADGKGQRMNHVASACSNARKLADDGHIDVADLKDIPVSTAEKIVTSAKRQIEDVGKIGNFTPEHIERGKSDIAKGAKKVIKRVKQGDIKGKEIFGEIAHESRKVHAEFGQDLPMFEVKGKRVSTSIDKMIKQDAAAELLSEVCKCMDLLVLPEDVQMVNRLRHDLQRLSDRALDWVTKLDKAKAKADLQAPLKLEMVK